MAQERITYKDIIDRFDHFEEKLDRRFNEFSLRMERIEARTSILERFNEKLNAKVASLFIFATIAINLVYEYIKERLFKS